MSNLSMNVTKAEFTKTAPKQPYPNDKWCVGCTPDNCMGCDTGDYTIEEQVGSLESLDHEL